MLKEKVFCNTDIRLFELHLCKSGKLMEKFVKKEETKWPPHCVGIFHQPKRPANKTKDN